MPNDRMETGLPDQWLRKLMAGVHTVSNVEGYDTPEAVVAKTFEACSKEEMAYMQAVKRDFPEADETSEAFNKDVRTAMRKMVQDSLLEEAARALAKAKH